MGKHKARKTKISESSRRVSANEYFKNGKNNRKGEKKR